MSERPRLRQLAACLGVLDGYESALKRSWVETSDDTREALAAAMGYDASSEQAAERALRELGPESPPAPTREPERCYGVDEKLGGRRVFGLWANLYSVRSGRSWGFGNLGDLEELVGLAAAKGADFIGLNPLHAVANRPGRVSPYTPVSRLFRNPLYLDPDRVPELPHCPEAQKQLEDPGLQQRIAALRDAERLDAGAVEAELLRVLHPLHACFSTRAGEAADARRRAFGDYADAEGDGLRDFATFQALADLHEQAGRGRDWRDWPAEHDDPHSPAVAAFRQRHRRAVDFHAWLQFELDRQLGEVARKAREAGLALGLYTDLALGSDPGGADAWALQGELVQGVTIGAPPDAFSPSGQDWQLHPTDPRALRASACALWRRLLRAGFRHAGALRIDHAMAMERLFWIPEGRPPTAGAYVRYPRDELLAVLAQESRRHAALVIGEDLGTLPEGFSEALAACGVLSSRVLLFERNGAFREAAAYPSGCLVTANTHDLPTLAALEGEGDEDLALRRATGHLPDDAALAAARAERRDTLATLRARLRADGYLGDDGLAAAVTRFLAATPAALFGISLDDLAGEREPVNLPGVSPERHPSWTRRMHVTLEELPDHPTARAVLAAVPAERRSPGAGLSRPAR